MSCPYTLNVTPEVRYFAGGPRPTLHFEISSDTSLHWKFEQKVASIAPSLMIDLKVL